MKKFFNEFKEFIARGNVIDMAVGVVVGAAFKSIIDSLVNDIIMPFIGFLLGDMDFSALSIVLKEGTVGADGVVTGSVAIMYGKFINNIISFIIIAFCLFCVVKVINKLRRKKEEEPAPAPTPDPEPSAEEKLLTEIRDLLKDNKAN